MKLGISACHHRIPPTDFGDCLHTPLEEKIRLMEERRLNDGTTKIDHSDKREDAGNDTAINQDSEKIGVDAGTTCSKNVVLHNCWV